MDSFT